MIDLKAGEKLDWFAYRTLAHEAGDVAQINEIHINLEKLQRVFPNGIVPLIVMIDYIRENGGKIKVTLPTDPNAVSLMERSGWLHYLLPDEHSPHALDEMQSSIPLQTFSDEKELNEIITKTLEIAIKELSFAEGVFPAFEWSLNEIADNVLNHAEAKRGWIQVVTYRRNHQLALIVCDSGIGIPSSLERNKSITFRTHHDALNLALQPGVTSKPEYGQGNGLAGAFRIAQASQGIFGLSSESANIFLDLEGKVRQSNLHPFMPGTKVEMQLKTDAAIDLESALWGHQPASYLETAFENEEGHLEVSLRRYASSFGNRMTGKKLRNLIMNTIQENPNYSLGIRMDDVNVISSSFADELFGKLANELGPMTFNQIIKVEGLNPLCRKIIDRAIAQRLTHERDSGEGSSS